MHISRNFSEDFILAVLAMVINRDEIRYRKSPLLCDTNFKKSIEKLNLALAKITEFVSR
jgi:hypothetical protein